MGRILGNIGLIRAAVKPDYTLLSADKFYYVHLAGGDDGTAAEGDPSKPYKTIQQAIDDADTSGNHTVVMVMDYCIDVSATEEVTMKGDVSLVSFHHVMLPYGRGGESTTILTDPTNYFGNLNQWVDKYALANMVYVKKITLDATWDFGNQVKGIATIDFDVKQDLAHNTSTTQRKESSNQYRIEDVYISNDLTLDEVSTLEVFGEWYRVYVVGDCFNTSKAAGTFVGGHWHDCSVAGNGWVAETVGGRYERCRLQLAGWGSTQDFTGYCYRCFASTPSGVWGSGGGDMMGTLELCYAGADGAAETGTISGTVRYCEFDDVTVSGTMSGVIEYTNVVNGQFRIHGTLNVVSIDLGNSSGIFRNTGYCYRCEITMDNNRFLGGTGSAVYYCTGVFRDCDITQAAGSLQVPIQAAQTTAANPLILDNVRIKTDNDYALISGGAAAATTQYVISTNVTHNAAVAYDDGLNFTVNEKNNVYQVTNNYR